MHLLLRTGLTAALILSAAEAQAAVKPNNLFSDNCVLQQGISVPVWGTAADGEKVTVQINGQTAVTTAENGRWMVKLRSMKAGGPYTLTIKGTNTVEVKNVLVGEVFICSGQSNMQWPVNQSADAEAVISGSKDPLLRLITIPRRATDTPQTDVEAQWAESAPETVPAFSAVAYHFGREIRRSRNVPVGLISTNYGGTPAEAWTRKEALLRDPELKTYLDRHERNVAGFQAAMDNWRTAAEKAKAEGKPAPRQPANPLTSPQRPTGLYNAMIAPLIPYAIRGAIWYQGESNAGQAYLYRKLMPNMIQNWREDWGQGDFPFVQVQLAPFMKIENQPTESAWAELREAQYLTTKTLKNTGQAVITDVGDENDIHPKQKQPVGYRLGLVMRHLAYGERFTYSGPEYSGHTVRGNEIVLRFKHTGGGLEAKGGPLKGFAVCGEDRRFVWAEARIEGSTVVVRAPGVDKPVAVRYGWANFPVVNLFNKEGIPATPFRTDDFPGLTKGR
jgi:sialate O-acetylesterase